MHWFAHLPANRSETYWHDYVNTLRDMDPRKDDSQTWREYFWHKAVVECEYVEEDEDDEEEVMKRMMTMMRKRMCRAVFGEAATFLYASFEMPNDVMEMAAVLGLYEIPNFVFLPGIYPY